MNRRSYHTNHPGCNCGQEESASQCAQSQALTCTEQTTASTTQQTCGCGSADEVTSSEKFTLEKCCDFTRKNIGTINLGSLGQVINACLTLCNVCPNRTVALGVTLAEIDPCGCETNIAFKSFEITTPCRGGSLKVNDITFVVPKNNNGAKRCFRLYATANYLDTNVCF